MYTDLDVYKPAQLCWRSAPCLSMPVISLRFFIFCFDVERGELVWHDARSLTGRTQRCCGTGLAGGTASDHPLRDLPFVVEGARWEDSCSGPAIGATSLGWLAQPLPGPGVGNAPCRTRPGKVHVVPTRTLSCAGTKPRRCAGTQGLPPPLRVREGVGAAASGASEVPREQHRMYSLPKFPSRRRRRRQVASFGPPPPIRPPFNRPLSLSRGSLPLSPRSLHRLRAPASAALNSPPPPPPPLPLLFSLRRRPAENF